MGQDVKSIVAALLLMALSACSMLAGQHKTAVQIPAIPMNQTLFSPVDKLVSEQEIFALSASQQAEFLSYYTEKIALGLKPHDVVAQYLQDIISNFTYYGKTYTAETALRLNQGNCMSLAILTTALAQLVDLDIDYVEVNTLPVFEQHKNLLLSSSHVQTRLYDPTFIPEENFLYLSRPGIVIDYFPDNSNHASWSLAHHQFLSMYYRNIAADALLQNNFNEAFANANKAHQIDPQSISVINLLGVIHRRAGDATTAEAIYQLVLAHDKESITLLNNYALLLFAQHRSAEAENVKQRLSELDDPNPYVWLEQAYLAQQQQDTPAAIKYFRKTIDMAPYVHQAYLSLYQLYVDTGQVQPASEMLQKALEWIHEYDERRLYKRKLYNLNRS